MITAPTTDNILDGITERVIQIAQDACINVKVRPVTITEIIEAHKNGSLKEVFGAGTAVVISPINSIGYSGENYIIEKQDHSLHNDQR